VGLRVEIARTLDDVERLRPVWDRLAWGREEAEHEYFVTRLRHRPDALGPFAAFVLRDDDPVAGLAARVEARQLPTAVGYRVLYAPHVRLIQVVDGGIVVAEPVAIHPLLDALRTALARREADAVALPPLPLDSPLLAAFKSLGGRLQHQQFIAPWARRRLVLPDTFEEFVASRSANTRWRIGRDARRIEAELGEELSLRIVSKPDGLEQLVRDADRVAGSTYQRALGAGFSDTPEQRALAQAGLEHGWLRGYLLYRGDEPIAYWLCATHGETILIRTAGFDLDYERLRVGIYLLMRVVEDAIADPTLRVLDFGPGDAAYKQQFSSESHLERNVVVFAPSFRGLRINAARTAILGSGRAARRVLDAAKLTDRVRARWRDRLRK
jgi:CelD/BcsL family acetyltransferase involved in cellulose biosynthesis